MAVTHDLNLALTFCTRIIVLAAKTVARNVSTQDALDRRSGCACSRRVWSSPRRRRAGRGSGTSDGLAREEVARAVGAGVCRRGRPVAARGPGVAGHGRVWRGEEPDRAIFVQLRVSRTLLGLFGGAALALAGASFSPCCAMRWQRHTRSACRRARHLAPSWPSRSGGTSSPRCPVVWAGALMGAAVVLIVVVGGATKQRQVSAAGLLLVGVAANSVCSAVILVSHSLSNMSKSFAITRWLMGSLDAVDYPVLAVYIAVVLSLSR